MGGPPGRAHRHGAQPQLSAGILGGAPPPPESAAPGDGVEPLPATARQALRAELGRAFAAPYETPIVVAVNGLLMAAAWFWLPVGLQDWLFTLHGPLAFPVVLATWMFADVPATNVLGDDARRVGTALGDPAQLRRLVYAKNAVLWLLAAPVCALIALGIGIVHRHWAAAAVTVVGILTIPLGSLGVAAWFGIRFPYHPLPLATRWRHRRPWRRMVVRWLTVVTVPYGLVPLVTTVLAGPALLLWYRTSGHWQHRIPDGSLAVGVAVTVVVAAAAFVGGHRVGLRLIEGRRVQLADYLAHPERG